jgi:hypothetical protein
LEVVGINALGFVVLVIEWTPFSFEEKDEELKVTRLNTGHQMVHKADF